MSKISIADVKKITRQLEKIGQQNFSPSEQDLENMQKKLRNIRQEHDFNQPEEVPVEVPVKVPVKKRSGFIKSFIALIRF